MQGGVGSACLEVLQNQNVLVNTKLFGFPDTFVPQGKPDYLYDYYGLSVEKIANALYHQLIQKQN